ncbi:hypothetical protein [Actinokineospora sp. HUAS TT18]|uniref:hypothetical protein n=1 Tax=Actinokineospora sp. HUAS TT18 TaxID=3447451 RepID=UPI003F51B0BD
MAEFEGTAGPRRRGLAVAAAILAALVVVAVATVILLDRDDTAAPPTSTTQAPTTTAGTSSSATTADSTSQASAQFRYQPLWPFAAVADAETWQREYRAGGHAPWHLDAGMTALGFTTGYLGFTGVSVVVTSSVTGDEALVTVGYPIEGRAPGVAAVLHLSKIGVGADAPWEVVGTKDTTLSLTQPGYGAKVASPVAVGGRITGVDESIRVQVRAGTAQTPLGEACCLPAGGENTPWSTSVTFSGAPSSALTVVASTGGHYTDVERFAVTAVRANR